MEELTRLQALAQRRSRIMAGGGDEKTAKQRQAGKLTARERLDQLFDGGSFVETDVFATDYTQADAQSVVTGFGLVNGRPVYAYAQDYTVMGGSVGRLHADKIVKILDMAMQTGAPVVSFADSDGARLDEGVEALEGYARIMARMAKASGVIPQIAAVAGPCAGSAAVTTQFADIVLGVSKITKLFLSGPQVLSATSDKPLDAETAGGAQAQAERGQLHLACVDEAALIATIQKLLDYLPSNNAEDAPYSFCEDDLNRQLEALNDLPTAGYDVKEVIAALLDNGDFLELQPDFAEPMVTGLGFINGHPVGVVANNSAVMDGAICLGSCPKAARFVRLCDTFNLPVITLTNTVGLIEHWRSEEAGILRYGAQMISAFAEATVPKINIILGRAYGHGYIAMSSKALGADMTFAWPQAQIAALKPESAVVIFNGQEFADAEDPVARRRELIERYEQQAADPYHAAKLGLVDDIISPAATRQYIAVSLEMMLSKRKSGIPKKHGNLPL